MKKVYKNLTYEQIKRGIIFSSCLSKFRTEQKDDCIHEVKDNEIESDETIKRLLNDKFFNTSPWKYNIIRKGIPKELQEIFSQKEEENKDCCECGSPFKTEEEEEIGFCGGCR